ncbi:iridoid oxidase [Heracleum sosnowskyi]|uniref:Iridoid oxidase n=1 Tax=Heracleum sosnowskyi TaxID=360622 RepID=A0AAD8ND19_9APIA|nr:iridoid oxidase [Heracleum sosnowskyi]
MDVELMVLVLGVTLLLWSFWVAVSKLGHISVEVLPPGPRRWPLVGNLLQLGFGFAPHESFAKLASKHGPIMTLWLGSMNTVVISSNEVARQMFKHHDVVLAGRKIYESMIGDFGNEGSLITAQYGPHWRMLRRLSSKEFFSNTSLDAMHHVRSRCIDHMVQFIEDAGGAGTKAVDVRKFFFLMTFNLVGNFLFSKDLLGPKSEEGEKFYYHAGKVMEFAGKANVADFFPMLRVLDPQGIRRKTQYHVNQAFKIAGGFLNDRLNENNEIYKERKKDFLDVLLDYRGDGVEGPFKFSPTTVNVIVFEMFTAGTDTTTSTLEWAMAELLHNPKTLEKVQKEVRNVAINHPNMKLDERDFENLPYLQAVIKETLRLHPPLPFLVPHMAMDSCNMLGYQIQKEAQVLVNVWAIGRDPKTWIDPLEFKPERFFDPNMQVDYKGQHFEFIPFGSGRRMCPAIPLASRLLPLALGSVLLSFDWVLEDGIKPGDMDMSERMGITLRKAGSLKAVPVPYIS